MIRTFNGKGPRIGPGSFISEAAYVIGNVEIGENASVWPGAVVRGDFGKIVIGNHTSLEDNCVVHAAEDLVIGSHVIVGHGAVVHCRKIGDHVLVGNNVTLLDGAEVGDFCIIAAGAVVRPDAVIPGGSLATGCPAEVKSRLTRAQRERLKNGAALYADLARAYKDQGL